MVSKKLKSNKRKTRKRGGEFVGQGTYGCGFYPGFRCKGDYTSDTASFFSKIMYKLPAEREWKISEMMKKIDPKFNFSIYPYKMCPLKMDDIDTYMHDGITRCSMKSPYRNISIKDDVATIRTMVRHGMLMMLQSEQGGENLSTITVPPIELYNFFNGYTRLFNGIEYYHKKGLYHLDIKPPNIVGRRETDGTYNIRFIDFGLSKPINQIIASSPDYKLTVFPNYPYYAYELRFLEGWYHLKQVNFQLLDEDIDIYTNNILKYITHYAPKELYYMYNPDTAEYILLATKEYYIGLAEYIDALNNNKPYDLSIDLYKKLLNAGDVFSLGLTLAEVYYRLIKHKMEFDEIYKINQNGSLTLLTPETAEFPIEYQFGMEISKPMYTLIKKMMDKNPFRRITIQDAKIEFKKIIDKMKPIFGIDSANIMPEISSLFSEEGQGEFIESTPPSPVTPQISPSMQGRFINPPVNGIPNSPRKGGNKTMRRVRK
jgi:serine/threonine protein kinase